MANPLVELKRAGVHRAGRWLVRGVDLEIAPGEVVTLIGPNGSGKTTTAKLALGVVKVDEGSVQRASIRAGYVPQKLSIDWTLPLSVNRFMRLTARPLQSAIVDALERTGVAHLGDAQLHALSGGELQRVMLARAIAMKPQLLVLDEPVQGVDFAGEIALYDMIGALRDELGCAILMVSHDLHVVMAATDRVICLNGHVCCQGTPQAVATSPVYRELFGERAAGAFAIYQHEHDHTHLPDGRVLHADGSVTAHCHPDDGHHHGHADKAEPAQPSPGETERQAGNAG